MPVPGGEWEAVARGAHAVIDHAEAAGVYVLAGGIDEQGPPVIVSDEGPVVEGGYRCTHAVARRHGRQL